MITVAFTVPVVFERSVIRGHPPIETSPRPSATGSLQAAVEAGLPVVAGVVVELLVVELLVVELLVDGAVFTVPVLAPLPAVLFAQTNLVPVFLHIYMTPFVFCV